MDASVTLRCMARTKRPAPTPPPARSEAEHTTAVQVRLSDDLLRWVDDEAHRRQRETLRSVPRSEIIREAVEAMRATGTGKR